MDLVNVTSARIVDKDVFTNHKVLLVTNEKSEAVEPATIKGIEREPSCELSDIDDLPSRPFKGFDWSMHVNVTRMIDGLFTEYKAWYKGEIPNGRIVESDKIKRHLTHFVLEAYRTHRAMPELCMGVHLGHGYYVTHKSDRYHPKHLSARVVEHVTDFLYAADYLERPMGMGIWNTDPSKRRTTRFRATSKLIRRCEEHGITPYMIVRYEDPEVIILRAKKKHGQSQGKPIDYEDTPFTRQARINLHRINDFISRHHINLDITDNHERDLRLQMLNGDNPGKDKYLDLTGTRLRRIFNNDSFEQGGRFYGGWWQQIQGNQRVHITINDKRTVQLDYSGMHFAIMYAEVGMDTPMEDPYALEGYDSSLRSHIKKAFNIIVNCANRAAAAGTINGRIKKGELSPQLECGEKLLKAFAETHSPIKDKIASGDGVRGQFTDSQIAERILLKGIEIDLCILPIHDGFITTAGDEYILNGLMKDAFTEVTGHKSNVKAETFDLSVLPDAGIITPYWVTRSDGHVEQDSSIEGKATSFSRAVAGADLWGMIVDAEEKKKNKARRDREWKSVHGQ